VRNELRESASVCATDALWATDNRYINKPIFTPAADALKSEVADAGRLNSIPPCYRMPSATSV
jgi:hypothetical protein